MDKKADPPALLASPTVFPSDTTWGRMPRVSGAVLQRARASSEPKPSPMAAEPLPAPRRPPLDEYLDEPDKIERWERIDGRRQHASPANLEHADPHFTLDAVLKAHLNKGYKGSTDLKTRVDQQHEYASDTCVRRRGAPETEDRHLEELVFEVVNKRSAADTKARARGFAARGVRRQIGIFVKKKEVREWVKSKKDWGEPLDLKGDLHDPCLAVPLPLAALYDEEAGEKAIALALEAKDDPTILEMKRKSKKRGLAEGLAEGLRAMRISILKVLKRRLGAVPVVVREKLEAIESLERLEEIFDQALVVGSAEELAL